MLEIMNKENSMSNNIFYDPYNEIRCDRFALEKLVKESEAKDQRIAELEEQLKNVPKYNVYSKVFFIDDCEKTIKEDFVEQIIINHRDGILYELINNFLFEESELFATKEEAEAKLQELGEKR